MRIHPCRARERVLTIALCSALWPSAAVAQWITDGSPVCTASGEQREPVAASDGASGAIVVWQDDRSGSLDLYAQRVTASGAIADGWPSGGVALCAATGVQRLATIAADGEGGAYVAWEDYRAGGADADIYLQRLTSSGTVAAGWPVNGLAITSLGGNQGYPALAIEAGAVIIVWQDDRSTSSDIYAQRVTSSATPSWATNGVALCTAPFNQLYPTLVGDGQGGAIAAWQDARSGRSDVYAQRVASSGIVQWSSNGVLVCGAVDDQLVPRAVSDGQGGAVVVWDDYRDFNADIFAQRIDGNGQRLWATTGVALCTDPAEQYGATPVSDGQGGVIVPWSDFRGGSGDLYAQRVVAAGTVAPGWTTNGVAVCTASFDQFDPVAVADGQGGMILCWSDDRVSGGAVDIYAQRLTANGGIAGGWALDGRLISDAAGAQIRPTIVGDGTNGGALMAWCDGRSAAPDIYAYRSAEQASVDVPWRDPPPFALAAPFPNPARAAVTLRFALPAGQEARLEILDLEGRRVLLVWEGGSATGTETCHWDGRDRHGRAAPAGVYVASLTIASPGGSGRTETRRVTLLR